MTVRYWNPRTLKEHQARYTEAVKDIYDVESVRLGVQSPPGDQEKHNFDFPDGMKMIVSKDGYPDGTIWIHFSISAKPKSNLWNAIMRGRLSPEKLIHDGVKCFCQLSGFKKEQVQFRGFSEGKGVPHFFVEVEK